MAMTRKALTRLALIALFVATSSCTPLGRGDVHLTVDVQEDNAGSLQAEFNISPVSDWFGALIAEIQDEQGKPRSREQTLELLRTRRGSQDYTAVLIHFSDVNQLATLVNTATFAQGLLPWLEELLEATDEDLEVPDDVAYVLSNVPIPFSRFEIRVDDTSPLWKLYEIEAEVNVATSRLVGPFADVAYHVVLPGHVTSSNAHRTDQGVMTWDLQEGKALEIQASSRVSKLGTANTGTWLLGGAGVLALALIVGGVVYWSMSRRRRAVSPGSGQHEGSEVELDGDYADLDVSFEPEDIWSDYEDLDRNEALGTRSSYSIDSDESYS